MRLSPGHAREKPNRRSRAPSISSVLRSPLTLWARNPVLLSRRAKCHYHSRRRRNVRLWPECEGPDRQAMRAIQVSRKKLYELIDAGEMEKLHGGQIAVHHGQIDQRIHRASTGSRSGSPRLRRIPYKPSITTLSARPDLAAASQDADASLSRRLRDRHV